jgi:geranylgeranyl pyrophosphate synthase
MMPFIPGASAGSDTKAAARTTPGTNGAARAGEEAPPGSGGAGATSLFAPVAEDLVAVERAIQDVAGVESAILSQTLRLILSAGGKRVRPALVVLAARLHENRLERRVALAVAAELLHTATLIHDDVLDESDARRGKPTINASFNNTLAVLTGDYLFGKSGELVASLDDPAIMGVFSWAVMELVKGEMLRPTLDGTLDETESAYLAKIRGKTASLFAMSSQTGAMLDAQDPDLVARLRDYGMALGMAFQVADDVLDFTATEAQLGKPVGSDLRHGTITLPAINYLRRHPDDPLVRGLLRRDDSLLERASEAVEMINRSGATGEALDRARAYAADALSALDGLRAGPVVTSLRQLARYTVDRHE